MIIKNVNCEGKTATITLDYKELRDISNGLLELSKLDIKRDADFAKIHRDMFFLFSLVKHECIDSDTIAWLNKRQEAFKEACEK